MTIHVDHSYITEILRQLIQIDSTNPSLVPGGAGEEAIARYVSQQMSNAGLVVHTHETEPGRPSVVGIQRGSGRGRSLMLNAHMDTVGVAGMADPFSGRFSAGRIYGRGAQDMKGSLAASLAASRALVEGGYRLAGDLIVAAVADEEFASIGTADVAARYPVDGAIVTEPTDLAICLAHKGFVWLEVEISGRAAHGSRFQDGIDANMRAGRFLSQLDELEQALRQRSHHPLVGPPSLHVARLNGGSEWSMYAQNCLVQIERRTIPGEDQAAVKEEIESILERLAEADPTFAAALDVALVREPFEIGEDAEIVAALARSAHRILGSEPARIGHTAWMDSALLSQAGAETVIMGPVGAGLHAKEEWVDVESVVQLAQILAETALAYCGNGLDEK